MSYQRSEVGELNWEGFEGNSKLELGASLIVLCSTQRTWFEQWECQQQHFSMFDKSLIAAVKNPKYLPFLCLRQH